MGSGRVRSPRVRMVAGLATTMPPFCRPIKPMNSPTPHPMARRRFMGMLFSIQRRRRVTLMMTNSTPERNTAPSPTCQL